MKKISSLFLFIFGFILVSTRASYEPAYGVSHHESSYAAPPVHHGGHHAGSYYHYHVPLVGQQQQQQQQPAYHGWHPPYHHQSDSHTYLWPLLILLALPLLFLPLLPLLLLPLGLSLLALILPLLMGGMMMMMMMMGGMMMPMGSHHRINSPEARQFGSLVFNDISLLMSKYARSLDLDHCPQHMACKMGSILFPSNGSQVTTAKTLMNYVVNQAVPKGKLQILLNDFKEAFWNRESGNCAIYRCQPAFRLYTGPETEENDQNLQNSDQKYHESQNSQVHYVNSTGQGQSPVVVQVTEPLAETNNSIQRQWVDYYKKLQKYYKGKKGNEKTQKYIEEKFNQAYKDYYGPHIDVGQKPLDQINQIKN